MRPVFIIGFSRTGSTLLQHVLHNYTPIGIVPEMHIYWPRRLHSDFVRILKKHVGDVDTDEKVDRLIELMFSKKLVGAFWRMIDKINLDVDDLRQRILNSDRSIRSIFDAVLASLAKTYNKEIMGAKFPVHFSYAHKLLEWYPDCRLIHTIRDPRAIFASQFYKRTNKSDQPIKRIAVGILQFIHVNLSFKGVVKMHENLKDLSNYRLYKYEAAVSQPEASLKELCDFLGVQFKEEMLNPRVRYNTSYADRQISRGFHTISVDAWRNKLPKFVAWMIQIINANAMKKVGYC